MKNSFKYYLALLLAFVMVLGLSACGGDSSSVDEKNGTVYAFVNTLKEPETNYIEAIEAPQLAPQAANAKTTINGDIIGWLQVPGTDINEPVVQSTNNSKYLRRNYEGKYDFQGSYFMDYESRSGARSAISRQMIIYGHNTALTQDDPNGEDFAQLLRFADGEFAATHPYIYYSSTEEDMVWQIFAVMYTDVKFRYLDMIDTKIDTLVAEAKARSEYNYDVEVDPAGDYILTLSTCTAKYGYANGESRARFVVMAKLIPADSELAATVGMQKNPSIKAPQL